MSLWQDLKVGFRSLVKNPGFTAVAVAALALGIGVNSTVFTFVNAVVLRGLPFEDADRIMHLENTNPTARSVEVSYRDFLDYRASNESFEDLGAADQATMNVSDTVGAPERVVGAWVSANTFSMLGQEPLLGRDFAPGEDEPGADPIALLGYGLWQNRYGGDPEIVGATVRVNEVACVVVGVMPEGMKFPMIAELWRPIAFDSDAREQRDQRRLEVFGRLKDGVTLDAARAEMTSLAARLERDYSDENEGIGVLVKPYNDEFNGGEIKLVFLALMGAVGFVLLIACANVANLLLARSAARAREVSIRSSMGASRFRVVRQLLVESLLLGSIGGAFGLLLSIWGIRAFELAVADINKPYWIDFSLDATVVGFFLAICVATSLLFGLAPALHVSKTDIALTLKEGSRGQAGGSRLRRATSFLTVAELALTLVLLVGAGLMMRSFFNLQNLELGAPISERLTMRLALAEAKYPDDAARFSFHERLQEKLEAVPGVRSVAITTALPGQGAGSRPIEVEAQPRDADTALPQATTVTVSPDYFAAVGVPVRSGRSFTREDGTEGAEVVIVNQKLAERYWPRESALGRRIRVATDPPGPWMQVVGVVPSIRHGDPNELDPAIYQPYRQNPVAFVTIVAHSPMPPDSLTRALRAEVQSIDPDLPVYDVMTLEDRVAEARWAYQVFSSMFVIFALIALILSAVGLYAITAFGVSQRTQEIGVRIALGAGSAHILRLVLRQGLTQLTLGLGLGLIGAFALTRVLGSIMIQVTPTDPLTFAAIMVLLAAVAVLAFIVPARRACRLDPVTALRDE